MYQQLQERFSNAFLWFVNSITRILFYTCCITFCLLLIERTFVIFSYEPHIAGIDNNFAYPVIRSLAGFSIYPDPTNYPFAVNPYAPLFFLICKAVALLLNISPLETIAVYKITRSVSFMADLGTCLLLFLTMYKKIKTGFSAAFCATTLFFCILCYLGYTINRVDSMFLFFYCSTLFVLIGSTSHDNIVPGLVLALLTTLCIFSKQNGITLLALVPVWLFSKKKYKLLLSFSCFAGICCISLFLFFQYVYTDQTFSLHVINALKNKIDIRWFYIYIFKNIADSFVSVPLLIALVISLKAIAVHNNYFLKRISLLFVLQLLFSGLLCLKWGSSLGYFNECFALACIVLTTFFSASLSPENYPFIKKIYSYGYPVLVLFILHISAQLYFFFLNGKKEGIKQFEEQAQVSTYIKNAIGTRDMYVVDLSNPDRNFFKNLLYKESAAPNIDAVSCCTLPDKIFDYAKLLSGLQTGKVQFLIKDKLPLEKFQWGVNISNYKKDTSFISYDIYRFDSAKIND